MKPKTKSKKSAHASEAAHSTTHLHPTGHPSQQSHRDSNAKPGAGICEEVEKGGFGSFDEGLETTSHCNEQATQFCTNCNKNLCNIHYESLHRSHDNLNPQSTGHGLHN